jgi:hypothetical protein
MECGSTSHPRRIETPNPLHFNNLHTEVTGAFQDPLMAIGNIPE